MKHARTVEELNRELDDLRAREKTVALVPTMGFLHEGHLSLADVAGGHADAVALSIFVNPTQFAPDEDYASYPRDLERDLALAAGRGVALAFTPDVGEIYPDGEPAVTVDPGSLASRLCGLHRPGHFEGVLTVVAGLLGLVRPDVAVFGQKDLQQAVLIRRMVRDLHMAVRVVTGPIVRESDGLAMSSRNDYLDQNERAEAPELYRGLQDTLLAFQEGARSPVELLAPLRARVERCPTLKLQYVEIVDRRTLEAVDIVDGGAVAALAAFCGTTRLIDNLELV